ncbi:MAG TPA: DUF4142 domain-containing protein [Longimicrobium sp.]|jgi:putative membrane protein|uniref:DUF4142 domain-containing protein n=1 Tax=Longimicrobium sp. TaxID=2029185 RepID=UPI002ED96647
MRARPLVLAAIIVSATSAACGPGFPDPQVQAASIGMANPDVADIALAANRAEIETGQLAVQRAESPAVRTYAQRMVTEHTQVEEQMRATLERAGIAPRETERSRALRQSTATTLVPLGQRTGADFDREYMRVQVQQHRWFLNALDESLVQAAANDALRTQLQRIRPAVATHLRDAERLLRTLGG